MSDVTTSGRSHPQKKQSLSYHQNALQATSVGIWNAAAITLADFGVENYHVSLFVACSDTGQQIRVKASTHKQFIQVFVNIIPVSEQTARSKSLSCPTLRPGGVSTSCTITPHHEARPLLPLHHRNVRNLLLLPRDADSAQPLASKDARITNRSRT